MAFSRKSALSAGKTAVVDGATLSNASLGMLAIFSSALGEFRIAAVLVLIALAMDYIDGKLARKMRGESMFGRELDSLADIISFGAAPAAIGVSLTGSLWIAVLAIVFVLCGIVRLAKFNVQSEKNVYFGMPITVNALIFSALVFFNAPAAVWGSAFALSSMIMVSKIKIKKVI